MIAQFITNPPALEGASGAFAVGEFTGRLDRALVDAIRLAGEKP